MPKAAKATPKKKPASKAKKVKAPVQKKRGRRAKKERAPASIVGGLQVPICSKCGNPIKPEDSYEILPGEGHERVHRPACKI